MTSGVYQIKCLPTGKVYVGSSVDIKKRWKAHRGHLNRKTHDSRHLQNAWNKYGPDAFAWTVLVACPADMVLVYEQIFINALRPVFNTAPVAGSVLGHRHTAEAKKNMSAGQRGWRKKYEWRGQSLCLTDIAEMEGVDAYCLMSRVLGQGQTLQEALSRPAPTGMKFYDYEGRSLTAPQWAVELGMHKRRIAYWLAAGMTIADCVARLNRVCKRLSFAQFCRISGCNLQTMKSRVTDRGMSVMDAVTTPIAQRGAAHRKQVTTP